MLFITVLFSLVCKTTPINYCVPAGVGHQSAHILVIRIKITNKSEKSQQLIRLFWETVPASLLSDVRLILFQDCSHLLKYFHYICLPDCCRGKDKRAFRIWHQRTIARNTSINFWNTFSHVRFNHFVVLEKEPYNSAETTAQFSCNERIMKP